MPVFPTAPVTPREFVVDVIPSFFADLEIDDAFARTEFKLGLRFEGEGGGSWTLHFIGGELGVAEDLAPDCGATILQRVEDWRAALWEGRPRLVAEAVERLTAEGAQGLAAHADSNAPQNPDALRELERLPGRIDAIIIDEQGSDWEVAVQIGPPPIRETPSATLRIGAEQAEAIRCGDLHPLEALITGQLRLEGDLGLILQLQAIAMAASMPPPAAV